MLIVFDFTNLFSLSHSKRWLQDALDASGTVTPLIFLVGAKKDLIVCTYKHNFFHNLRVHELTLQNYALRLLLRPIYILYALP